MKAKSEICVLVAFIVSTGAFGQEANRDMQLMPVDGGELEYQVLGDGEPILLIHGGLIAGTPESFLTQPALSDWQLITYHRRGYAGSAPETGPVDDYIERHAADAASLLQYLDIDGAHVLGHSSGGTIAIQLAFDHPELVESLILLEPAIPALVQEPNAEPIAGPSPIEEAFLSGDIARAVDLFMEFSVGQPDWRSRYSEAVIQQVEADASTFARVEAPSIASWTPPDDRSGLGETSTLYLSGSRSPVSSEYVDVITEWFPDTEHRVIQDASHAPQQEEPSATAEAVRSFLNER